MQLAFTPETPWFLDSEWTRISFTEAHLKHAPELGTPQNASAYTGSSQAHYISQRSLWATRQAVVYTPPLWRLKVAPGGYGAKPLFRGAPPAWAQRQR